MRTKPYTERGLPRVPCVHCGEPSSEQWTLEICALANKRIVNGLCLKCDIEINRIALEFIGISNVDEIIERYKEMKGFVAQELP